MSATLSSTGPIWRAVLALALPALAQQYLHLLVRLSDQYLADNFILPDPAQRPVFLAALTTAGYLYWFVSSYTVVVSVGATALVARFVGAGDWRLARHATGQAVTLAIGFGLLGSAAGLFGLSLLVEALQLTGDAAHFCTEFLTPLAALLVFQITESACVACLAGAGDTRTGLKVLGLVAALNVPLAWTLCFGIGPWGGLGFVGISLGTGLSHMVGCVLAARHPRAREVRAEAVRGRPRPRLPAHPAVASRERAGRGRQPLGRRVPAVVPQSREPAREHRRRGARRRFAVGSARLPRGRPRSAPPR